MDKQYVPQKDIKIRFGQYELRPTTIRDIPRLLRVTRDPRVSTNICWMPTPFTLDDAVAWVTRSERGWDSGLESIFSILKNGRYIGTIAFHLRENIIEVGYWLDSKYWGRGIVTNSLKVLMEWASRYMGSRQFFATTAVDNIASQVVLMKCGFRRGETTYSRLHNGSLRLSRKFYLEYDK